MPSTREATRDGGLIDAPVAALRFGGIEHVGRDPRGRGPRLADRRRTWRASQAEPADRRSRPLPDRTVGCARPDSGPGERTSSTRHRRVGRRGGSNRRSRRIDRAERARPQGARFARRRWRRKKGKGRTNSAPAKALHCDGPRARPHRDRGEWRARSRRSAVGRGQPGTRRWARARPGAAQPPPAWLFRSRRPPRNRQGDTATGRQGENQGRR